MDKMESHKRVLGILYIVMGSIQLLTFILLATFFSALFPLLEEHINHSDIGIVRLVFSFIPAIFFCLAIIIALPSIIGGVAMLRGSKWALTLLLILGCLKLLSFPIGTALGVYTIWVYAEDTRQSNNQSTPNVQA